MPNRRIYGNVGLHKNYLKSKFSTYKKHVSIERLKGCVRYIFASLFYMSKREHFRNKEKYFLFHFESSSRGDNQILTF